MPTITLAEPWTYRTALATIEFPAGAHEVSEAIAALAPAQPIEEPIKPKIPAPPRTITKKG